MRITIAAVGRLRAGPERSLIGTYLHRTPWPVDQRDIEIRRRLPGAALKAAEAEALVAAVPTGAVAVALDERGTPVSSQDLAHRLADWRDRGHPGVAFLIGGADGHGSAVRDRADAVLSLGPMTWPHMLVRVMLAEQIYRAWSILEGHPYHRA